MASIQSASKAGFSLPPLNFSPFPKTNNLSIPIFFAIEAKVFSETTADFIFAS